MTEVFANERVDDLEINGLKLIQNPDGYCFTSDSVLLANSVAVRKRDRILDIGTGSGIIAVLLAGKLGANSVTAVDIQDEVAAVARRNVILNGLSDKIDVVTASLAEFAAATPCESFDTVVTNPPYKKTDAGKMDENPVRAISKYELKLSLAELIRDAAKLLKFGGKFYMVHRADRLAECIFELKKNKIEPKVLTLVYPKADKSPDVVIYECIKGAAAGIKIRSLTVFGADGGYTPEAKKMYAKD